MPKPNHRELNSLVDPHRTLEEIFEEGKKRCMALNAGGEDDDEINKNKIKESKAEKKQRIKTEQVKKHMKDTKIALD